MGFGFSPSGLNNIGVEVSLKSTRFSPDTLLSSSQPAIHTLFQRYPSGFHKKWEKFKVYKSLCIIRARDAEIEIDGMFAGTTPRTKRVDPGEYKIKITRNGYKNWEKKIKVEPDEEFPISVQLERK